LQVKPDGPPKPEVPAKVRRREYNKEYYKAHAQENSERCRKYRKAHAAEINERKRMEYRKAHATEIKERARILEQRRILAATPRVGVVINKCAKCGHEWPQSASLPPRRCPAAGCRTVLWRGGGMTPQARAKKAAAARWAKAKGK
jgi:hypothetical protein